MDHSQPHPPDSEDLRSQAQELRKGTQASIRTDALEASLTQKILAAAFFILVLSAVFGLLAFAGVRRQFVGTAAQIWERASGAQEDRVFKLPPPARETVVGQAGAGIAIRYSVGAESSGESVAGDIVPPSGDRRPLSLGEAPPQAAEKTGDAVKAYQLLQQKSSIAARLVSGDFEGYLLKKWEPVRNDPPRYLISMVVEDSGGQEAQLVWQVDLSQESVRALSQLARDLESAQR